MKFKLPRHLKTLEANENILKCESSPQLLLGIGDGSLSLTQVHGDSVIVQNAGSGEVIWTRLVALTHLGCTVDSR